MRLSIWLRVHRKLMLIAFDQIVVHARAGRLADPALRVQIGSVLASVSHLPHVTGVVSPFGAAGAHAISADGRTGFATIAFDERADLLPKDAVKKVISVARARQTPALSVELGGRAIEQATPPSLGAATS